MERKGSLAARSEGGYIRDWQKKQGGARNKKRQLPLQLERRGKERSGAHGIEQKQITLPFGSVVREALLGSPARDTRQEREQGRKSLGQKQEQQASPLSVKSFHIYILLLVLFLF
ncbi:hypothetical protein C1H46_044381 [Malus baccata]|uniref:Uncharacterized protein n=1 Tax=Malus baccata TaxID=106549 RepID=A0A540K781_MALBA|nr:hypothetical protein C1H46_044381 [Malus baccata]